MAKSETLCPKCGFSPIPERAETCPKCGENFAFHPLWKVAQHKMISKTLDSVSMESTTFGGLTGEVSANPVPASVALGLCALVWLLRASGVAAQHADPQWLFAIAAAQLGAASMLMATIGPATAIVQLMGALQLVIPFVVMGDHNGGIGVAATSALPGAAVLFITIGEPGPARRTAGLIAGVATFVFAVGAVFGLQTGAVAGPAPGSLGADDGWDLKAGEGFSRLARADLLPHLTVPSDSHLARHSPFGNRGKGVYGVVSQTTAGQPNLTAGCEDWLKAFGGTNEPQRLGPAPALFGPESLLMQIKTASGAQGRIACGMKYGKLWALTVVSTDPTATVGAQEYERIEGGFSVRAPAPPR